MKTRLLLICTLCHTLYGQELSNSTNLDQFFTWSQEPSGYDFPVALYVPDNGGVVPEGGYPVCILLHGGGGNGDQMINQFSNVLSCHILVAPTGYQNSWNICQENSDAPDTEFIGLLIDTLQTFANVNPDKIRILGSSNGAALANRIFIENENVGVDRIVALVSQLNTSQFHDTSFYKPSGSTDAALPNCGYNTMANPSTSRAYLSICNDNDPSIPYNGGLSVGVEFIPAEEAAYLIAQYKGYSGSMISGMMGNPIGIPLIFEDAYPEQEVYHIRGNAFHGANESQLDYVKAFLEDCSLPLSSEDLVNPEAIQLIANAQTSSFRLTNLPEQAEVCVVNTLGKSCTIHKNQYSSFTIEEPAGIYYVQVLVNNDLQKILPYYNRE
ncbi:MAG: hypothetical protein VXY37_01420 [Bacteroidota bacterium]|nr:hypothetical protein [Bacteroidota bacterium]